MTNLSEEIQFSFLVSLVSAAATALLFILLDDTQLLMFSPFHIFGGWYSFLKLYIPSFVGVFLGVKFLDVEGSDIEERIFPAVFLAFIFGVIAVFSIYSMSYLFFKFLVLHLSLDQYSDFGIVHFKRLSIGLWGNGGAYYFVWNSIPILFGSILGVIAKYRL